jgi:DNA gyrase inhibitor GyrI
MPGTAGEGKGPSPEVSFGVARKMIVASLEVRGDYGGTGAAMRRLKAWAEARGVLQSGDPFCMFYDNPLETPEEELRSEVCIQVSEPFVGEGDYKMKVVDEAEVAETRHSGDPEEFYRTYGPFLEGLMDAGYQLQGPAREYFMEASDVKGPGSGYLIQQPVKKRQSGQD